MMKKLLITITLLSQLFLFVPTMVLAQSGDTSDPSADTSEDPVPAGSTPPTLVRIPGMIGVPVSQPVNDFNGTDDDYSESIGQGNDNTSGNRDTVSECSSIKFKSVLDILIWLKCIAVAVLIPLIFAAAFVVFLWGIFKFMYATDSTKRKEAQKRIWWGLIGLFVMVSVWGIIKIAGQTLGIDPIAVPLLQTEYLDINKASR
jgi:hypothetical protein